MRTGRLTVRRLGDTDAQVIHRWLNDPAVLEHYEGRDRPHSMPMVMDHFLRRADETTACLVLHDADPIGYIQFYPVGPEEKAVYGLPPSERTYGMDQFLGEPGSWNRGIGTELVSAIVRFLFADLRAERVVMDPHVDNLRAIRCYEKCGFRRVRMLPAHERHEGEMHDCWQMELLAPGAGPGHDTRFL